MGDAPQHTIVHVHNPPSNGLGTAAGICSILGMVSCGLLCPVGLVLGLCSVGKEPKGMALTGVILGAIGSLIYLVVFIFFGGALLVMCGGCIGLSNFAAELAEKQAATKPAADAIIAYYDEHGELPDDSEAELLISAFTHEGSGFRYEPVFGSAFVIKHPGDDGVWDTQDDWVTSWDADNEPFNQAYPPDETEPDTEGEAEPETP